MYIKINCTLKLIAVSGDFYCYQSTSYRCQSWLYMRNTVLQRL